jgi:phosphopantothenoylcysteine decarboxylase / phosphopantothenate---cysteine ligase
MGKFPCMIGGMSTTARALLEEIEAFLAATSLTATKFGLAAVNDGHLVANLRKGSSVTLKTADRVRAYMRSGRASERADGDAARRQARVLLIIGGGIAAYKCLDLIRRLRERGSEVRTVMTSAAQQFLTPLAVGALSGAEVFTELFDLNAEREIGHIRLSRAADLIVVAPATADLLAKMAAGQADDLACCVLLATDKPVLVAPAMNPHMWLHPATRRNVARLAADGIHFVGPSVGEMAERGEAGPGRLAEVPELLVAIDGLLVAAGEKGARLLAGRHVLVTSGPTHEPIDPVRYIANRSSGKQGAAIAAEARAHGARVTLISGPTQVADPPGVAVIRVETAREMLAATRAALPADIAIFAAAVADWRVAGEADQKIKKGAAREPRLELVENPDILATIAGEPQGARPLLVIGFAAETERVVEHARQKRIAKRADWIVANDVSQHSGVMGGDRNRVHLVTAEGVESWPELDKVEVARRLVLRAAERLAQIAAAR